MSIKALSMGSERDFVSKFDTAADTPDATIFKIGTLDGRMTGRIRDMATTMIIDPKALDEQVNTTINTNEMHFQAAMYGLRGWENFSDEKGDDVKFKTVKRTHGGQSYKVVNPEILSLVPQSVITEIGMEVMKDNDLSDEEGNG